MIQIDIDQVALNVTPPRLRSYEHMALVDVLTTVNRENLQRLYAFAEQKKYEMQFNGQVCYLEHVLNDQFDNIDRRIYISDPFTAEPTYLFNTDEDNEPVYVFNVAEGEEDLYLGNVAESSADFIVHVPQGQVTNWALFRAWVDRYRLQGKSYEIIEFI